MRCLHNATPVAMPFQSSHINRHKAAVSELRKFYGHRLHAGDKLRTRDFFDLLVASFF